MNDRSMIPKKLHQFKYLPYAVFLLVGLAGVWGTLYVYSEIDTFLKRGVAERAQTIAAAIDPATIGLLTASESDLQSPAYQALKERMVALHLANHDSRFVYLMGNSGESIFFYVDSENPASEDYSPPGQMFDEATPVLKGVFKSKESAIEIASDRWGNWVSGLAPIIDRNGNVAAIAGIDIDASGYFATLLVYSSIPLLAALVLLLILVILYRARLEEERRVDARAELLAIASHEIRAPLTGIRWATERLLKQENLNAQVKEPVARIYDSSLLIIDRINNLLAVNSLEHKNAAPRFTDVHLKDEIMKAINMITLVAEHKGMQIVFDEKLTPEVTIVADVEKIQTLFANLLSNAVKYGAEHSTISVGYQDIENAHEIRITNTGKGIPEKDLPHIFSGYYRAGNVAAQSDGTGMGLFLTKRIVDMHKGTITVTSNVGGETAFTIRFPKQGLPKTKE